MGVRNRVQACPQLPFVMVCLVVFLAAVHADRYNALVMMEGGNREPHSVLFLAIQATSPAACHFCCLQQ